MKDQHKKISGYRELSQLEIDAINKLKRLGEEMEKTLQEVNAIHGRILTEEEASGGIITEIKLDRGWFNEGKKDMQKGLMCVIRSVAQPTTF